MNAPSKTAPQAAKKTPVETPVKAQERKLVAAPPPPPLSGPIPRRKVPRSAQIAVVISWITGPAILIGGAYAYARAWSHPLVLTAIGVVAYLPLMVAYSKLFPTPIERS